MPGRGIQHLDLAVSDVERSLSFYRDLLGPLGLREEERYPTYRGTEEVVYLSFGDEWLGLRPADGGTHRYYGVGLEHLAFDVATKEEVERRISGVRGGAIGSAPAGGRQRDPGLLRAASPSTRRFRIEVFSPGPGWSSRIHAQRRIARAWAAPSRAASAVTLVSWGLAVDESRQHDAQ